MVSVLLSKTKKELVCDLIRYIILTCDYYRLQEDTAAVNKAIKEKEDELVGIVLSSLQEMRIKFPGKSDMEAEHILDKIMEDWKFHKPRVASYWLVKLDSIKRRKVGRN